MHWWLGLCPGPRWRSLQLSTRAANCILGGRFAAEKGSERDGREERGQRG